MSTLLNLSDLHPSIKHLKISIIRITFEIDQTVTVNFITTPTADEKHNKESIKLYQKTRTFLTKKNYLSKARKKVAFLLGPKKK